MPFAQELESTMYNIKCKFDKTKRELNINILCSMLVGQKTQMFLDKLQKLF